MIEKENWDKVFKSPIPQHIQDKVNAEARLMQLIVGIEKLDRYDITGGSGWNEGSIDVDKDNTGDWVRWDDIEQLINQVTNK